MKQGHIMEVDEKSNMLVTGRAGVLVVTYESLGERKCAVRQHS